MSFFTNIHKALDTKLNNITGVDIAWENTEYTPVKGTAFIRPTVLMSASSLMDLNDLQMNEGIYQIDIFYPLGNGAAAALTKADEIYDLFKGTTTLTAGSTNVYIKEISRTTAATREDSWFAVMIEIHFKVYDN